MRLAQRRRRRLAGGFLAGEQVHQPVQAEELPGCVGELDDGPGRGEHEVRREA